MSNHSNRERLSSRLGFILLSAGCAIGCGNVWKFPTMTGENGGGGFVLIYILCLLLLGLPVMTMEFSIGRAAQASPVGMYQKLQKPGQKWHTHGYFALFGNVCLMSFYTVVSGWIMYYFYKFLTGQTENLGFGPMISDPQINMTFMSIVVVVGFGILCFKLQGGLERITKYMMIALLGLMVVLAVNSFTLSGAEEGLKFYLMPDFGKIDASVVVAAMNQAFFSLSVGIGSMAIFGSYIGKERSLMGESANVILLDTFVAIMAGLIIFPACFTYDIEVGAGPGLLFDTMATVFNNMSGGRIWGTIFFLFMVFASMSTILAVFENILACVREKTGWSRPKGSLVCAIVILLTSSTTALGYSVLTTQPFAFGSTWLELWDFIVSTNLLPLGSLVIVVFCCNKRYGWGWKNFMAEANTGKGMKVRNWMKPIFCYVVPAAIIVIYVVGLVNFPWTDKVCDAGDVKVVVLDGWEVVSDQEDTDSVAVCKKGEEDTTLAYISIDYFGADAGVAAPDMADYEGATELEPMVTDGYTWTGFTYDAEGSKTAVLWTENGEDCYQATVELNDKVEEPIELTDSDVQYILAQVEH